ncbi:MAG: hypothetical protein ACF8R7_03610 [Phycisphaerales bacterium JB039]
MSALTPSAPAVPHQPARVDLVRWFYPASAAALLVGTIVGFQLFYFHGRSHPGRPIPPPIRTLIIVHGVAMSAWMLLMVLQPTLVALRKRKLHMAIGKVGVGLAAAIVVLGVLVGVRSAQVTPPELILWTLTPKQFLAVPLGAVLLFGAMVGIAVWKRRKPIAHRAMMLSATLMILPAAISRIDALSGLYAGTDWERLCGPYLATMALGVLLLAVRCALTRSFDRWLAGGVGVLNVTSLATMANARTGAWDAFASLVVS